MAADSVFEGIYVPEPEDPESFEVFLLSNTVEEVLEEIDDKDGFQYQVRFRDDHRDTVGFSLNLACSETLPLI